ncbi:MULTISPECIES: MFS transporter [Enterobacterales]|uniref:MFS transporter n=1 Tax=Enterobacterales TaxID=91347 RepID=UPI001CCCF97F|nr:MFS transporter [Klebsiella michiganensis]MBZ7421833.1 MFS transporter [Klebsiella michiganensis]
MEQVIVKGRVTLFVGLTQLINWGITFYLLGAFGQAIGRELGWTQVMTYSGQTLSMGIMGLTSPFSGRILKHLGGKKMMASGIVLNATGCLLLAASQGPLSYWAAWVIMGAGMRLSLYDAAFAVLVDIAGPSARKSMTQVTLLGGLASVAFWPVGAWLLTVMGWRAGTVCYGLFALMSLLLLRCLPDKMSSPVTSGTQSAPSPCGLVDDSNRWSGWIYAALMALLSFLSTGISAHLPAMLAGFGVPVLIGTLWGVGQVSARLSDVFMGAKGSPLGVNMLVGGILPFCFVFSLFSFHSTVSAALFVLSYGAANGLSTLVRATLPLVMFDKHQYADKLGTLLMPSFFLSALAPAIYASLLDAMGIYDTLLFSLSVSLIITVLSVALSFRERYRQVA